MHEGSKRKGILHVIFNGLHGNGVKPQSGVQACLHGLPQQLEQNVPEICEMAQGLLGLSLIWISPDIIYMQTNWFHRDGVFTIFSQMNHK